MDRHVKHADPTSVDDLIRLAGGPQKIAVASARFRKVGHWAVQKWRRNGIPDEHWSMMIDLTGVDVEVIFKANEAIRHSPEHRCCERVAS